MHSLRAAPPRPHQSAPRAWLGLGLGLGSGLGLGLGLGLCDGDEARLDLGSEIGGEQRARRGGERGERGGEHLEDAPGQDLG